MPGMSQQMCQKILVVILLKNTCFHEKLRTSFPDLLNEHPEESDCNVVKHMGLSIIQFLCTEVLKCDFIGGSGQLSTTRTDSFELYWVKNDFF